MESLDHNFTAHSSDPFNTTWQMRQDWHVTARWARFMSIVSFVMAGISLIGMIVLSGALDQMMLLSGMNNPILEAMLSQKALFSVIILVIVGAQVAVNLFQFRFSNRMKEALQFTDQTALEDAWLQFSNFFKWSGIMIIAFMVLYFILLIFMFATFATMGG